MSLLCKLGWTFSAFVLSKASVSWNPERLRRRRPRWVTQRHKLTIADEMAAPLQLPVVCCVFTDAKRRSLGSLSFPETADQKCDWFLASKAFRSDADMKVREPKPKQRPTSCLAHRERLSVCCEAVHSGCCGLSTFWRERYSALTAQRSVKSRTKPSVSGSHEFLKTLFCYRPALKSPSHCCTLQTKYICIQKRKLGTASKYMLKTGCTFFFFFGKIHTLLIKMHRSRVNEKHPASIRARSRAGSLIPAGDHLSFCFMSIMLNNNIQHKHIRLRCVLRVCLRCAQIHNASLKSRKENLQCWCFILFKRFGKSQKAKRFQGEI